MNNFPSSFLFGTLEASDQKSFPW